MNSLLQNSVPALLFTVIGLGYFLGAIKIRGYSIGIAAVLFVGLGFGAYDPEHFVIPEVIYVLGLVLFIYSVGIQSGPLFFNLFRKQWLKLTAISVFSTLAAAIVAVITAQFFGIAPSVIAGVFCGSLTNTPGLAATIDTLRITLTDSPLAASSIRQLLNNPAVGYSVAYPYGVLGIILAMLITTRLFKVDFRKEEQLARKERGVAGGEFLTKEFCVTNPQIIGKRFDNVMLAELTGMVFSRYKRQEEIDLTTPEFVLQDGDVLRGVGPAEAVSKAELLVGPTVDEALDRASPDISHRDFSVINRKAIGMTITKLSEILEHAVVVSRIRRGLVEIAPTHETTLELGDQIRVVAHSGDLDRITQLIGDPIKDFTETDYLSFSLGLVLGVAIGMISIPLFGGSTFRLGFAGGSLVAGLVLGRLGRTGPIVWTLPPNAAFALRQLGILLFLAGIGTRAGGHFLDIIQTQGPMLLITGILITTTASVLAIVGARWIFKYDMISTYGILAGVHTQPAALVFANAHTGSESPNVSYASIYPVALITKIILAQLLIAL